MDEKFVKNPAIAGKNKEDSERGILGVPVVFEPVVVPVPLPTVPVEIPDIEVAVRIANVQNAVYTTALRMLSGLYRIRDRKSLSILHRASLLF